MCDVQCNVHDVEFNAIMLYCIVCFHYACNGCFLSDLAISIKISVRAYSIVQSSNSFRSSISLSILGILYCWFVGRVFLLIFAANAIKTIKKKWKLAFTVLPLLECRRHILVYVLDYCWRWREFFVCLKNVCEENRLKWCSELLLYIMLCTKEIVWYIYYAHQHTLKLMDRKDRKDRQIHWIRSDAIPLKAFLI